MDDVVTAIERQKKNTVVTVNEVERLLMNRDAWTERSFEVGESVDLGELKAWLLPRQYPEALNAAVRFLAVRPRSVKEIERKLESLGYMDDTIEMAIYKLQKNDLINDERFAAEWARAKSGAKLGKRRILMELREKGVASDVAERAVSELDDDALADGGTELALKLLRRYESYDEREAVAKVMAAMARRGYGFAEARDAIERAIAQMSDET